jgi:putative hydrolase of the HAD superfamily
VGDSVRDDLEGATKAGLTGVLLDRAGRSPASGRYVIRTLEEVLPLVMSLQEE